ncbi:Rossmann-fold NAD(P)-binding domain-containing protein [Alicyclobacillus dauci]|uniref:KARI N-terminal Rossmann domain-containing protein n=1 Tax=Alicyclobacillus dauci TaxID=1475485 RepID=A0ABY6YYL7_9BACL|nr:hypothetical protein [Alicyclobacillus dauci]WAH35605.1 hypothetical protein NZD86_15145 [Alicyclobacillus dauci]
MSEGQPVNDAWIPQVGNKTVAIFGYREDGKEHAEALRRQGINVIFGIRDDRDEWSIAIGDGQDVRSPEEAAAVADIVQVW